RVFRQELARDTDTSGPRVVESWHPGNLAYAAMRSPDVAGRWLAEVRRASDACALVVHLTESRETLAARQHEPGPASFFHEVGEEALEWSRRLGLRVLVLDSAVLDPDALLLAVLDGLHERNR
ncbi:MAG TPA: hypothetical protein QGF58_21415, partial [Myxococcota bacterium]|nr:hypothetical protein [Myxococcota bacterium]